MVERGGVDVGSHCAHGVDEASAVVGAWCGGVGVVVMHFGDLGVGDGWCGWEGGEGVVYMLDVFGVAMLVCV